MFEKFVNTVLNLNNYSVILINFIDNKYTVQVITFSVSDNILTMEEKFEFHTISDIVASINNKDPLLLLFTGTGIVNRKRAISEDSNYLINSIDDGYYKCEFIENNFVFISIARKEKIDTILSQLKKNGFSVLYFALGPFVISSLKILLNNDGVIYTEDEIFEFRNNYLIEVKNNSKKSAIPLHIGEELIEPKNTLQYASIIHYLHSSKLLFSYKEILQNNKSEFIYKNLLKKVAIFSIIFFFLSLVMSKIFYYHYHSLNFEMQRQLDKRNISINRIDSLKKNNHKKEAILLNSNYISSYYHSYILGEIMDSIPNDLFLETLDFSPIINKPKKEKKIQFNDHTIEISGVTFNNDTFNDWLVYLRKQKWMKRIILKAYKEKKAKDSYFEIIIYIKENV